MLVPYRLNTLFARLPLTNWILIGLTGLISLAAMASDYSWVESWILDGWGPTGMLGHLFLHAGLFHLAGNLIFLTSTHPQISEAALEAIVHWRYIPARKNGKFTPAIARQPINFTP